MGKNKKRNKNYSSKNRTKKTSNQSSIIKAMIEKELEEIKVETMQEEVGVIYDPNEYFINPYAFVPISDNIPSRANPKETKGSLTGRITCDLQIKSPIFIPNTTGRMNLGVDDATQKKEKEEKEEKEHWFYDFYSYEDLSTYSEVDENGEVKLYKKSDIPLGGPENPVIPGSSIRGMIRSIYEQLTNSCLLEIDKKNLPYKRTTQPKKIAMLKYENDVWKLHHNPEIVKVDKSLVGGFKQGEKINVIEHSKRQEIVRDSHGKYTLHLTGKFSEKKYEVAFDPENTKNTRGIEIESAVYDRLISVVESYENKKVNKHGDYEIYEAYRKRLENREPVLVYGDDDFQYLSPSCITKEYFLHTIDEILEKQKKHDKCTNSDNLCPACRLFGMIGARGSYASRVRFANTYSCESIEYDDVRTLPILGKPQISATEFYLKQPNKDAVMWNYDYYTASYEGKSDQPFVNTKYIPKLMGRKVYWHGKFKNENADKNNMNCTVRAIKKGMFKFHVYFEDLTEEELENLFFCLTLRAKGDDEKGIHKIGKGKPIGMGDVNIDIDKISVREYKYDNGRLTASFLEKKWEDYEKEPNYYVKQILAYTKAMSGDESEMVEYPSVKTDDSKIYEWFSGYKYLGKDRSGNRGETIRRPVIQQTLPELGAEKVLKKY